VLSRLGGDFKSAWSHLKHVFIPFPSDSTRVYNVRLYEEKITQQQFREGKSRAGRQGAVARWGNENIVVQGSETNKKTSDGKTMALPQQDGTAIDLPMAKNSPSSSSSSSSSVKTEREDSPTITPPKTAKNSTQAQKLSIFYKQYIMLSSSPGHTAKVFHDALARGLSYVGMMSAIESRKWAGQDIYPWMKAFEKEHRKKEARPPIYRASDDDKKNKKEGEEKRAPPVPDDQRIKKELHDALMKTKLQSEKSNADQPKPDEKPC
jgi:hypothetical protein